MLDFRGETKRVKSFAYGLPHLGSPGIHNLDALAMKCDSNFTFILKPTKIYTKNIQCTSHNICITLTDDRCSFENNLTISVIHPQAQTLKFYCYYPHLTGLRSRSRPNKSNHE